MTPMLTLRGRVIGQGHQVKKYVWSHFTILQVIFDIKGHIGQGQRLLRSRSKFNVTRSKM